MKWKTTAVLLLAVLLCCIRGPTAWYGQQDRSIKMPRFDATTRVDLVVDGATLQALRVAAEDFFPPSSVPVVCADTQVAHKFKVSRRGDIIFVRITQDPEACGWQGFSLDGSGTYAISTDGRILRRVLAGEEVVEEVDSEDGGQPWRLLPANPDGGTPIRDLSPILDGPYTPLWMFDAGVDLRPDAGGLQGPDAGLQQVPAQYPESFGTDQRPD